MKKIIIPEELQGKPLFQFLVEHKDALIAQKKMVIKHCDPLCYSPGYSIGVDGVLKNVASAKEISPDATSFRVKVAANTSMWCDSQLDVLLRDSGKKSMKEKKGLIPHLHDHDHKIGSEVGDVVDIYYEDIPLMDLGYKGKGSGQALIFETDVQKEYNPMVFNKYRTGKIKQHSIGLMYIKIGLAIDDEEMVAQYELWKKYIDDIINKEYVEEKGFFWAVPEYRLLENSCVLFGSNELTPTLEVTDDESAKATPIQPASTFNVSEAISKGINFFN